MKKKKIPTLSENCKEYLTAWELFLFFMPVYCGGYCAKLEICLFIVRRLQRFFMEIKDEKNEKNEKVMCGGAGSLCLAGSMSCFTMAEASENVQEQGSGSDAVFIKNVGK